MPGRALRDQRWTTARPGLLGNAISSRPAAEATIRLVRYRAGQRMRRHAHDWSGMSLVIGGQMRDAVGEGGVVCQPLMLLFKPAGVEHETCVGPEGATTIHVEFGPGAALALAQAGMDMERCSYAAAGPATGAVLRRFVDSGGGAGLAAMLCGLFLERSGGDARAGSVGAFEFASREIHGPTFASAAAASMHPVAFARRFRRVTGVSPTAWKRRQRVAQAASRLGLEDTPIASVAHSCGFADQAHLSRVFRAETGITPGAYRDAVHALRA